jgi:hypothetical protein
VRIFKNAWFQRFSIREKISDETLKEAVNRVQRGLIDSDLGGSVLKQRIARPGQGKSGGYRTIILFKKGERAFFVFGFAKNERANINDVETVAFKKAAKELLSLSDEQIRKLLDNGALAEV